MEDPQFPQVRQEQEDIHNIRFKSEQNCSDSDTLEPDKRIRQLENGRRSQSKYRQKLKSIHYGREQLVHELSNQLSQELRIANKIKSETQNLQLIVDAKNKQVHDMLFSIKPPLIIGETDPEIQPPTQGFELLSKQRLQNLTLHSSATILYLSIHQMHQYLIALDNLQKQPEQPPVLPTQPPHLHNQYQYTQTAQQSAQYWTASSSQAGALGQVQNITPPVDMSAPTGAEHDKLTPMKLSTLTTLQEWEQLQAYWSDTLNGGVKHQAMHLMDSEQLVAAVTRVMLQIKGFLQGLSLQNPYVVRKLVYSNLVTQELYDQGSLEFMRQVERVVINIGLTVEQQKAIQAQYLTMGLKMHQRQQDRQHFCQVLGRYTADSSNVEDTHLNLNDVSMTQDTLQSNQLYAIGNKVLQNIEQSYVHVGALITFVSFWILDPVQAGLLFTLAWPFYPMVVQICAYTTYCLDHNISISPTVGRKPGQPLSFVPSSNCLTDEQLMAVVELDQKLRSGQWGQVPPEQDRAMQLADQFAK